MEAAVLRSLLPIIFKELDRKAVLELHPRRDLPQIRTNLLAQAELIAHLVILEVASVIAVVITSTDP